MQHKLIMLAGSSPGAGKSTLAELLFDQFTRHQLPTRWIYEEDILYLLGQILLQNELLRLIVFDEDEEVIIAWIPS